MSKPVLATAGNALALPFAAISYDRGGRLVLEVTHTAFGVKRTDSITLPTDAMKVAARCILDALDFPEDGE